jgi:hypothetical protein
MQEGPDKSPWRALPRQLLTIGRHLWMALCVLVGLIVGTAFGYAQGGVLGAIACGLGGLFVGFFFGSSLSHIFSMI